MPTNLNSGDLAFTGYITNGSPDDSFSFVNLVPLTSGTVIYFTDNGWTGTGFRGVTASDGDGNENLIRFTANADISAGTVIRSTDTSANFTWTTSGSIGTPNGSYAPLSFSQTGEQIAAVQSTNNTNPLFSGFTAVHQIDNTGTFENANSSSTGSVITGLSQAGNTAVLFNNTATYAAFNLNTLSGGTREQWLAAINNASNWTFGSQTALPTGSISVGSANTAPTISPISPLSGVISDPTNPGVRFIVSDAETAADSLVVTTTSSSNSGVAPVANVTITPGTGGQRIVTVNPIGVGYADLTISVTDGDGLSSSTVLNYAASAASVTPSTSRFHTGTSDASTAIAINSDYMLVADDEDQKIRLYDRTDSGLPINSFDFTSDLGLTDISGGVPREVDIEASTRVGNRIYWLASHSNSSSGSARPNRYRLFATDISGSDAGTSLSYVGRYDNLRSELIAWGDANGYNFTASAAIGNIPEDSELDGFNIEGLTIAPNGTTAYVGFRAPNVPTTNRTKALIAPITNFTDLVTGAASSANIGAPIEFDLGGRGIRSIDRNANNQYLIVAGPADGATGTAPKDFRLYTWTGNVGDAPELRSADLTALNSNGSFESIVDLPDNFTDSSEIGLLVDNGDTVWYNDGQISKELAPDNFQKFRSDRITLGSVITTIPTVVSITATDATAAEASLDPGTFRITRTGSISADLTVEYTVTGQAINGTDYNPTLTGTATILAGNSFVDISITPVDDSNVEGSETATLNLVDTANYDLGSTNTATVNIADNDNSSPATLAVGDIIFNEYASDNNASENDFFELLVLKDNADLRGLRFSDNELVGGVLNNNESVFVFGNDSFLSSVPKGTTVAVWTTGAGVIVDTTANAAANDWKLVLAPGTGVTAGTDGLGGSTNVGLSTGGEALYLYLPGANGNSTGTDNVYLDFVSYEADAGEAPAGLTDLNLGANPKDNAYYTGNTAAGNDSAANWVTSGDLGAETPGDANPTQDLNGLRVITATAGVTIAQTNGSTDVNEAGETSDTYAIALNTAPSGNVQIEIAADGETQVSADGVNFFTSVTVNLNSTNPQTITVRALNDTDVEGSPHTGVITHNITSSSDPAYSNALTPIPNLNVNVIDNDVALTPIYNIQGSGTASPLVGNTVLVEAIVTGDFQGSNKLNGFYVQEAVGDGNAATSDGIFVFAPNSIDVSVGDKVRLTGKVSEAFNQTQIDTLSDLSVVGTGAIASTNLDLPVAAVGDLESYEGMLITFPETLTVTENFNLARFGEVTLSSEGRLFNPTNNIDPNEPNNSAVAAAQDLNNRRKILLDDASSAQNPSVIPYLNANNTLRTGDTTTNLTGVLGFGFSNYRLQPTIAPTFNSTNPRTAAPEPVGGNVKVASFNVLNYFNGDGLGGGFPTSRGANTPQEFARQRTKIFAALAGMDADVFGLIEVENDGDGLNSAIADLVNGLNSYLGATTYDYIRDPASGVGTDEIKTAFIYKPGKVTPIGAATSSTDPIFDRLPVAQTFSLNSNGEKFTPVVNHFKSKGNPPSNPNDPNADRGDGQGPWNLRRTQQAQALLDFVNTLKTTSGDNDVLAIGDLNAYGQEDPIDLLTNGGLVNEIARFVPNPYSFVFEAQSGYLDHALTTPSLSSQVTGVTEWHINADEPRILDYNLEFKGVGQSPDLYAPTPYRSSDHDPVIVGLNLAKTIDGTPNQDNLIGTSEGDIIDGKESDDYIDGKAGNDRINGGAGNLDRIFGGDGNDTIADPDGVNGAHGGKGNDVINVTFAPNWDNNTNPNDGPRSDGKITGGYGDDDITVTMNHAKFFINLKGDEPVNPISNHPNDGSDRITLLGTYANSVVDLGGGNDLFNGGNGADNVTGSSGNDTLIGGGGNDQLNGNAGNDSLTGGAGSDRFVLAPSAGTDTITDFADNLDKIGLSGGLSFGQLTISQGTPSDPNSTGITRTSTNELLAILSGISASSITSADFVTV